MLTNRSFCSTCLIETGLSDLNKMTLTVFKGKFVKCKPKIIPYRDFKRFSNDASRQEVLSNVNNCNNDYNSFTKEVKEVINIHAPQKKMYIRGNQAPFMNSILNNAQLQKNLIE